MNDDTAYILERFADNLPGAAFIYTQAPDGLHTIEFLNDRCSDVWGISTEEIGTDPTALWAMVHQDDLASLQASVVKSAQDLSVWEAEFRITDGRGEKKQLVGRGTPEITADGGIAWVTFIFDITLQAAAKEQFQQTNYHLEQVSEAIPDAFAMFNADEKLIICNSPFAEIYGEQDKLELKGQRYRDILVNAAKMNRFPDAKDREADWVDENMSEFFDASKVREQRFGDGRWLRVLDRPTIDGGRVSFRIDISKIRRRQDTLEEQALTDGLTGLLNRRGLAKRLDDIRQSSSAPERLTFFHIDLDNFKSVNDAQGHDAGDCVLAKVASRLQSVTGQNALIARVGGDEFVVVEKTNLSKHEAIENGDTYRDKINKPIFYQGRRCHVGASIGISVWANCFDEAVEQALLDADTALLAGKARGRNRVVQFDETMRTQAVQKAQTAAYIREGILQREFVPYFQPQLELESGKIVGFEALARWQMKGRPALSAGAFIDVANETGLIEEIDAKILTDSLDAIVELADYMLVPACISINVSSIKLRDNSFVETLQDEMLQRGLSVKQVTLEVLESTLLDDRSTQVAQNIEDLSKAGFRIELDDFGTGHTALASLQKFPVDCIKIDRCLVENIDKSASTKAITKGIFDLCQTLNVSAIAEGVETQEELDTLISIGIKKFQGYLIGKPMPLDELKQWLSLRNGDVRRSA
jgi:diguanylate cyclase (GGDEF)-like protein